MTCLFFHGLIQNYNYKFLGYFSLNCRGQCNIAEALQYESIEGLCGEKYFGVTPRIRNQGNKINKQTSPYISPVPVKQN